MKKYIKGFTLIELLVVIAIIGILSSIVLVSLNTARQKGKDTRVIADIQQLRTSLESDFNGNYNASFTAASGVLALSVVNNYKIIEDDIAANGTAGIANIAASGTPGTAGLIVVTDGVATGAAISTPVSKYALYGKLTASPGKYFCISSDGSTNQTAIINNALACPAAGL